MAKKKPVRNRQTYSAREMQLLNRPRLRIKASYDTADATDNANHWANADSLSTRMLNSTGVRQTLRNRARYEVKNNSYALGIEKTLVNDTIGRGPRPQIISDSRDLSNTIETAFVNWARSINFFEKLRVARAARNHDGEAFMLLSNNPLNEYESLDIRLIEAEQIATPYYVDVNENAVDGIIYDQYGNPLIYHLLDTHPGDLAYTTEKRDIAAPNIIHWFQSNRPGLCRGIPEITPALNLFAMLRRFTLATLTAAETAASVAAVLKSDAPAIEDADLPNPLEEIDLPRGTMMTLPAGTSLQQFAAEHPNTTYSEFKHEILNEIARCLNMPYNIAACNSSSYNYASGRLDHQTYYKSIKVDQSYCETKVLAPIFWQWFEEWVIENGRGMDYSKLRLEWYWDGMEHVDPAKEANAQETKLKNMTTSLATEYAKVGKDWLSELEQIAGERAEMKRLGLEFPTDNPARMLPAPQQQEENDDK